MLGKFIDILIMANIKTWHKDTLLKDRKGNLREDSAMTDEEKAKIFLEARVHNGERADARDKVDLICGEEVFSAKVNYYGKRDKNKD